jgi:hypothetical protein
MPSFPPRSETVKKSDQLIQRKNELSYAVKNNYTDEKLNKAIKKYREAQLSFLKAKIHVLKEKEFQNKPHSNKIENIEEAIGIWKNKTDDEILKVFKK